jgi:hypothetical protein
MFRNSWVQPQEEGCMCSMVFFTCIGVSSLVGRRLWTRALLHIQLSPWEWTDGVRNLDFPTHHGAHTDASTTYHTAYTTFSLSMNRRGSKPRLPYAPWCSHRRMYNVPYCIYNCLPEFEPTGFETCTTQQKWNTNLWNCALCCIIVSQCTAQKTQSSDSLSMAHQQIH